MRAATKRGAWPSPSPSAAAASRARRNRTGSMPAACASSSMNDWMTNAWPLLPGARTAPVGTPDGMTETSRA